MATRSEYEMVAEEREDIQVMRLQRCLMCKCRLSPRTRIIDNDGWAMCPVCEDARIERDLQELTAHFAILIGANWDEIYAISKDSVECALFAIDLAFSFLALWDSKALEECLDDEWDGSWLEHIDSHFLAWSDDYTGEKTVARRIG